MFKYQYEQFDIVEDCSNFFKKIKKLKLYIIKFNKNTIIKPMIYLLNFKVYDKNQQLFIIINFDKFIFSIIF